MLALLPLTKENGIVFVAPFALDALLAGAPRCARGGARRRSWSASRWLPRSCGGSCSRSTTRRRGPTWVLSDHADEGPYVVVLRAMFGFENGVYLRQNLANAFIVNYLWLPTLLALVTLVLIFRRPAAALLRRPAALLVGPPRSTPGRRSRSRPSPSRATRRR